jgi:hypothetical protein
MGLENWFGWGSSEVYKQELPDIFPLAFKKQDFIYIDVIHIYSKILTDVIERTHGLSDEQTSLLWDNCLKSESCDGLITMLAKAMTNMRDLFLIYDKALAVIREAKSDEAQQIKEDYKTKNKSALGIYISFGNYKKSELVKLYSALEYCTIASLNKSINLSVAIQLKFTDMRQSTGLNDKAEIKAQAQTMAKSLAEGKDIMLDAKDVVENAVPDLTAIKESIEYLNEKRSFYLGLPDSYICGEQTGGLGDSGEADTKAIERGLKNYFESIVKPVLNAIFNIKVTYKSQDFGQIESAMDVLKTFSLTDETLVSQENKQLIINRLFDLPEDAKGDPAPAVDPNAPLGLVPGQKAPPPGKPATPPAN